MGHGERVAVWTAIGVTFLSALTGWGVVYYREVVWQRAQLEARWDAPSFTDGATHWTISVVNDGPAAAKNCRIHVVVPGDVGTAGLGPPFSHEEIETESLEDSVAGRIGHVWSNMREELNPGDEVKLTFVCSPMQRPHPGPRARVTCSNGGLAHFGF